MLPMNNNGSKIDAADREKLLEICELPALSKAEQEQVKQLKGDLKKCVDNWVELLENMKKFINSSNEGGSDKLIAFNKWFIESNFPHLENDLTYMASQVEGIFSKLGGRDDYVETKGMLPSGKVQEGFSSKSCQDIRVCSECGQLIYPVALGCPNCFVPSQEAIDLEKNIDVPDIPWFDFDSDSDTDTVVPLSGVKPEDEDNKDEFDSWGSFPLNPPDPLKWDARADICEHVCSNLFDSLIEQKERGYAEAAESVVSLSCSVSEIASAVGILSGFGLDNVQESIYKRWVYDKFFGNGASTLSTLTNKLLEGLIEVKPYLDCNERMVQALISPETEIFPKGELEEEMSSFLYGEDDEDDRVSGREYVTYIPLRVAQEKARLCPECGLWVDKTLSNCECSHFFEDYIDPAFGDVQELNVVDKRVTEIALNKALGIDDDLCIVTEFNGEEIRFINGGLLCEAREATSEEFILLSLKPYGNLNGFYIYLDEIKKVYPHNAEGVIKAFNLFISALEEVASRDFALSFVKDLKNTVPELKDIMFEIEN